MTEPTLQFNLDGEWVDLKPVDPRINTAGPRLITPQQLDAVVDILTETERLDKITVDLDLITRTITLVYEDLDDEWFNDLWRLGLS